MRRDGDRSGTSRQQRPAPTIHRRESRPDVPVPGRDDGKTLGQKELAAIADAQFAPDKRQRRRKRGRKPGTPDQEQAIPANDESEAPEEEVAAGVPSDDAADLPEPVTATVTPPGMPDMTPGEAAWIDKRLAPDEAPLPESIYDPEFGPLEEMVIEADEPPAPHVESVDESMTDEVATVDLAADEVEEVTEPEEPDLITEFAGTALDFEHAADFAKPDWPDSDEHVLVGSTDEVNPGAAPVEPEPTETDMEPALEATAVTIAETADAQQLIDASDTPSPELVGRLESKIDELSEWLAPLWDALEQDVLAKLGEIPAVPNYGSSSDAKGLQKKLNWIIASLEDIQSRTADYELLKNYLQEIKGTTEIAQAKKDILAGMLSTLNDDIRELRVQLGVTNKAALDSARSVHGMSEVMSAPNGLVVELPVHDAAGGRGIKPSALIVGVGILLLSWSMMFYLKTGNVHLALMGLVVVNLAGCATILFSRNEVD